MMWAWLMVVLGFRLRWRLVKGDGLARIICTNEPCTARSTISQIESLVEEGWAVVEEPVRPELRKFITPPCF